MRGALACACGRRGSYTLCSPGTHHRGQTSMPDARTRTHSTLACMPAYLCAGACTLAGSLRAWLTACMAHCVHGSTFVWQRPGGCVHVPEALQALARYRRRAPLPVLIRPCTSNLCPAAVFGSGGEHALPGPGLPRASGALHTEGPLLVSWTAAVLCTHFQRAPPLLIPWPHEL